MIFYFFYSKGISFKSYEEKSPQEVFRAWFEGIIKNEWENVFSNMVNVDGKPYSEECKKWFKDFTSSKVGATYQLKINRVTEEKECSEFPEVYALFKTFDVPIPKGKCIIISYSALLTYTNGATEKEETEMFLFKVDNKWKVIVKCPFSESISSQTSTKPSEEYEADKIYLTIDLPKTTFRVNESFEGKFIIENKGKLFDAFVLFICRSKDPHFVIPFDQPERYLYPISCKNSLKGTNSTFQKSVKACSRVPLKTGAYEIHCDDNYFIIPGNYTFEIRVYSCSQIANTSALQSMGVNCSTTKLLGGDINEAIRQYAVPIKILTKDVIVI